MCRIGITIQGLFLKSSRDELESFFGLQRYVDIYMFARLKLGSRGWLSYSARCAWDWSHYSWAQTGKNVRFPTDYFIREYLFSTWLTSFNQSLQAFFRYTVFLMSFSFILVTRFRKIFTETENAESAPYLFSLFYKTQKKKV